MTQEKEYLTLDEAAEEIGMKRSTIYPYLRALNIQPEKFELDRKHYISRQNVERIKALKAQPWRKKEI